MSSPPASPRSPKSPVVASYYRSSWSARVVHEAPGTPPRRGASPGTASPRLSVGGRASPQAGRSPPESPRARGSVRQSREMSDMYRLITGASGDAPDESKQHQQQHQQPKPAAGSLLSRTAAFGQPSRSALAAAAAAEAEARRQARLGRLAELPEEDDGEEAASQPLTPPRSAKEQPAADATPGPFETPSSRGHGGTPFHQLSASQVSFGGGFGEHATGDGGGDDSPGFKGAGSRDLAAELDAEEQDFEVRPMMEALIDDDDAEKDEEDGGGKRTDGDSRLETPAHGGRRQGAFSSGRRRRTPSTEWVARAEAAGDGDEVGAAADTSASGSRPETVRAFAEDGADSPSTYFAHRSSHTLGQIDGEARRLPDRPRFYSPPSSNSGRRSSGSRASSATNPAAALAAAAAAEERASRVAAEVLSSEESYVAALEAAHGLFAQPLEGGGGGGLGSGVPRVHPDDAAAVFANLGPLLELHKNVLDRLRQCAGSGWEQVHQTAATLTGLAPYFRMYGEYVSNFDRSLETLQRLCGQPRVRAFFRRQEAAAGAALPSLLIAPVQRLPRLRLLLEAALAAAEGRGSGAPEACVGALREALELVAAVAGGVNERRRHLEGMRETHALQELIPNLAEPLMRPDRRMEYRCEACFCGAGFGAAGGTFDPPRYTLALFNNLFVWLSMPSHRLEGRVERAGSLRAESAEGADGSPCVRVVDLDSGGAMVWRFDDATSRDQWLLAAASCAVFSGPPEPARPQPPVAAFSAVAADAEIRAAATAAQAAKVAAGSLASSRGSSRSGSPGRFDGGHGLQETSFYSVLSRRASAPPLPPLPPLRGEARAAPVPRTVAATTTTTAANTTTTATSTATAATTHATATAVSVSARLHPARVRTHRRDHLRKAHRFVHFTAGADLVRSGDALAVVSALVADYVRRLGTLRSGRHMRPVYHSVRQDPQAPSRFTAMVVLECGSEAAPPPVAGAPRFGGYGGEDWAGLFERMVAAELHGGSPPPGSASTFGELLPSA